MAKPPIKPEAEKAAMKNVYLHWRAGDNLESVHESEGDAIIAAKTANETFPTWREIQVWSLETGAYLRSIEIRFEDVTFTGCESLAPAEQQ